MNENKKKMESVTTVKVTQIRSMIGLKKRHRSTLKGLGLGKIGRSKNLTYSPEVKGMMRIVDSYINYELI